MLTLRLARACTLALALAAAALGNAHAAPARGDGSPACGTPDDGTPADVTPAGSALVAAPARAVLAIGRGTGIGSEDGGRPIATGPNWLATFDGRGATFVPALGSRVEQRQDLGLRAVELRRGSTVVALAEAEPRVSLGRVVYARAPGVEERFEARLDGLEHTLLVAGPVGGAGELVVRVELDGAVASSGVRRVDGSHHFAPRGAGVAYGRLFGIDAAGRRCDGDVRLVPGGLELVLPADFVTRATWPILLDPVVSALFSVSDPAPGSPTAAEADSNPAVAFDDSTDTYMAVWERRFAANGDVRLFYQRFDTDGDPVGSQLAVTPSTAAREPRVVNLNGVDRFAIAWIEASAGLQELRLRTATALPGSLSAPLVLASSTSSSFDHDLAGESVATGGVKARAFSVWSTSANGVQLVRVNVPPAADAFVESTTTVAADPGIFEALVQPRISRATSSDGRLGVGWIRDNALANTRRIQATVVARDGTVLHTPATVSGNDTDVATFDIDGGGANPTRYVVAWSPETTLIFFTSVRAAALASDSALVAGPPVVLAAQSISAEPSLSVGWRPGSAVVVHDDEGSIRERRVDPVTGNAMAPSSLVFAIDATLAPLYFVHGDGEVCMHASGGDGLDPLGVVVAHTELVLDSNPGLPVAEVVSGRFVSAFPPTATAVDLGGGCGSVGTLAVPQAPALGNGTFSIDLAPAPTALFGVLNIAPVQPLLTCGACSFAAPGTTYLVPVGGPLVSLGLPIPATSALAGVRALAQWFVVAPGAAPCSFAPDLGATNVVELTLN